MSEGPEKERRFDLEDRLIAFACRAIDVAEAIPKTLTGSHIAGQLVRCGTSAAPNYTEALGAESRRDFLHKLKIALKELRETRVWLLITQRKAIIKPDRLASILTEVDELISIFVRSIETAQKRKGDQAK